MAFAAFSLAQLGRLQLRLRSLWRVRLTGLTVLLNPRLRSTPARFLAKSSRIEVSPTSAASPGLVRVLIHELAHAAAVELRGPRVRPHGKEWRALVQAAERADLIRDRRPIPPERRPAQHKPRPTARYLHTCPVCQFSRTARRRVTTWRCPECRASGLPGTLTIERTA